MASFACVKRIYIILVNRRNVTLAFLYHSPQQLSIEMLILKLQDCMDGATAKQSYCHATGCRRPSVFLETIV